MARVARPLFLDSICALGLSCRLTAGVMKLVDVPDSKSGEGNLVWVRLPPPAF